VNFSLLIFDSLLVVQIQIKDSSHTVSIEQHQAACHRFKVAARNTVDHNWDLVYDFRCVVSQVHIVQCNDIICAHKIIEVIAEAEGVHDNLFRFRESERYFFAFTFLNEKHRQFLCTGLQGDTILGGMDCQRLKYSLFNVEVHCEGSLGIFIVNHVLLINDECTVVV